MKTRKLGNLTVSAIGYGCMGLSHGYGELPPEKESIRLIRQAYACSRRRKKKPLPLAGTTWMTVTQSRLPPRPRPNRPPPPWLRLRRNRNPIG